MVDVHNAYYIIFFKVIYTVDLFLYLVPCTLYLLLDQQGSLVHETTDGLPHGQSEHVPRALQLMGALDL